MKTTDRCPLVASFDAADQMLSEFEQVHESPEVSRAEIAVHRRAAEIVRQSYPCPGPVAGEDGRVRCPLSGFIGDVFQMAAWRVNPPMQIAVEKVIPGREDKTTGQFL
jgi:hypothetical protein